MVKRAGESMTTPKDVKTEAIIGDIERTRADMSRTVDQIEERLSPAHIKEQVASVTAGVTADIEHKVAELKQSVIGGYQEAKDHVKDDLGRELREAKHMVSDEITHARTAVRDATVGRVEHMVHDARDTVTDAGTTVLDTIKANPVPAALIGVGLGWLIFGARRPTTARLRSRERWESRGRDYGYGGGYGYAEGRDERGDYGRGDFARGPRRVLRQGERAVENAIHTAGEGASNLGHRVADGASHLAEQAQGTVRGVGERVNHLAHDAEHRAAELASTARLRGRRAVDGAGRQLRRAERNVESTFRDNPLALGAVAIAVGAAIGLSLPHTEVEDEWMGDAKDRLLQRAEGAAGEAIHKAEETVGQLTSGDKSTSDTTDTSKKDGQWESRAQAPDTKNGMPNGISGGTKSQAV